MWLYLVPYMFAGLLVTSLFGIYQLVWRYISLADAILIARSHAAFSAIIAIANFTLLKYSALFRIPRSIILIQFLVALVTALGVRALRRITFEWSVSNKSIKGIPTRVVLVGAGPAGMMVARELAAGRNICPVGFLDDDQRVIGTQICGLRVLGPINSLPVVVRQHDVDEVIICVAREQQTLVRRIWALCEQLTVRIRTVPTMDEILQAKINIAAFRDVEMHDLMERERTQIAFTDETAMAYQAKRILITGAGGSIGSELAFQLAKLAPRELILLDKDENGLHDVCLRIHANDDGLRIHPVVADLRFPDRIQGIFSRFRPDVVFHAAAHKHVPLMEVNPCEAILNNVTGTRNLVENSLTFGVGRFVLISTDKAVKPASIMGASKRVCEMLVQLNSDSHASCFCCVRFGNVLGSRGSVVPAFQKLIARGAPLHVTHEDVERYLMTISEAVSLLLQAGSLATRGETFVLDMGKPVLIRNLANRLIEHCGLRPGRDVPIEITHLGPGEKLSEELFDGSTEILSPTSHSKINRVQALPVDAPNFVKRVAALELAAREDRAGDFSQILRDLNIGFCGQQTITAADDPDDLIPALAPALLRVQAAKQG